MAVHTSKRTDGSVPPPPARPQDDRRRAVPLLSRGILVLATTAVGLMAGFFYAYDVSVTRGLALVDDATYVQTMTAINATIRNAQFGAAFFGAIPLGIAALAVSLRHPRTVSTTALIAGGVLLYGVTLAVTAGVSIPLNNELAVGARTPGVDLSALRAGYEAAWNSANAVRTATNIAAFALLTTACAVVPASPHRSARS